MSSLDAAMSIRSFKIVLVGEANVGKTSILLRFCEDTFTESNTTIDIDFKSKITTDLEGGKVKLNVWDTAGQERFRAITSSLFHGVAGVVVVFDLTKRDSFKKLPQWLETVSTYTFEDTPVILVGSKTDLDTRVVDRDEAKEFAQSKNMEYFECSAKDGTGVNEAFDCLLNLIYKRQGEKAQKKEDKIRRLSLSSTDSKSSNGKSKKKFCVII